MVTTARRKRPVHWFPQPGHPSPIVFLTVCTDGRARWLANAFAHSAMIDAWHEATRWLVGRYVLMPDHLHLFCAPTAESGSLESSIGYWKARVTRALGASRGALWQREYWDRQLRREESYEVAWEYVRQNPVRSGLAECADAWPFQGELHPLAWYGTR